MSQVVNIQLKEQYIDVNKVFAQYKYAIAEHEPIRLSNGMYLHSYKVTKYNDHSPAGDIDAEQDAFDNELY